MVFLTENIFLPLEGSLNLDKLQDFIEEETKKQVDCALKVLKGTCWIMNYIKYSLWYCLLKFNFNQYLTMIFCFSDLLSVTKMSNLCLKSCLSFYF